MKEYRNHKYFLDEDKLWKILCEEGNFIVALDDSKEDGERIINWENNTAENCEKYIDWMVS